MMNDFPQNAPGVPPADRERPAAGARRSAVWTGLMLLTWVCVLAVGFAFFLRYKTTPAEQGRPPSRWPAASQLALAADRPTLVLFAHPRCPCTEASVSELARLMSRVGSEVQAYVVVLRHAELAAEWDGSSLWNRSAGIPGVEVVADDGGIEAERFQADVSGLVVLYDQDGRRLFSGGITSSRGHEGDSFGQRRLLALLKGETPDRDDSPVFGCALGTGRGYSTHDNHRNKETGV